MVVVPFKSEKKQARLGELLCARGVLTDDQLHLALHEQKQHYDLMGRVLLRLRLVSEEDVLEALSAQTGYPTFYLKHHVPEPEALGLWDKMMAEKMQAVPLAMRDAVLDVAMLDPMDVRALDQIKRLLPPHITLKIFLVGEGDLQSYLARAYGHSQAFYNSLRELGQAPLADDDNPTIKTIDALLVEAVALGASDIHLEPEEKVVVVRTRVDGVLQQLSIIHRDHWPKLAQRLKVLAGMDIVDSRNIQDGRFNTMVAGQNVDFRVSILPTLYGENIVIRVLDQRRALLPLEALGFSATQQALLKHMIQRPEGMLVITGPTGSGKTTTLYALLQLLKAESRNIMTLEDPIEYKLDGIRQTQVREQFGLGFAQGVRAILRQDPDVVLIGEIRDPDTAQMALRAAMTGSQVLTTLHTQDCFGVFPRLREFGVSAGLMAGNIMATVAQRLVRALCPHCKTMQPACAQAVPLLGEAVMVGTPRGCARCRNTGYRGRVVVSEILPMDAQLDEAVAAAAPRSTLLKIAAPRGFISMVDDGVAKLRAGIISFDSLKAEVDLTTRLRGHDEFCVVG